MKRPQLNGNKIVTRYTDATSIALRNYIDISAQRLNKVRAGKHLVSVLKSDTNDLMRRHQQTPDLGRLDMDREPMSLNGFSSHRSEKPGTSGKQILLSDFMGTYLTQKNIDEELLSKKEDNIYQFFREKFGLMGKYLGEDVLKAGLAGKASRQEGERPRKYKNADYESKEQHQTKNNNEEAGLESKEDPASRINHINRQIMGMILKEEHDKEMEALMQLQTEQNMQVFNDLQDIGYKESDKKAGSLAPARISPTKMILKNNFLRNFVELSPETPQQKTEEKFFASGYRASKKKHTTTNSRPQSEYLVFRTHQKREAVIPDIDKISSQFDSHKFGKKAVPNMIHHVKNVPSSGGIESLNTEDAERLKVARQLSLSKLDTPQVTVTAESVRHKTRLDTANANMKENVSTVKSIKTLIGEEIEFLNNNRDPNRQRANTAMEKVRVPSRFAKQQQVIQIENRHVRSQENTNTQENEMALQKDTSLSQRSIQQTREGKRQVLQDMKKNIPVSKSQTRLGNAFEENNTQLQGIRIMKKNANAVVTHISPKMDVNSMKFVVQTPVVKGQVTMKREVKNAISSSIQSRTTQNLNSLLEINSEKPSMFTKPGAVKRDQGYLQESDAVGSSDYLTGTSSVKMSTKGFIFDQRSGSGSNLLMKPNFGNKYWRNTFND